MPAFTFEIIRYGEAPLIVKVLMLPDERAIWCQVEALALQLQTDTGAFIRVKNHKGQMVIRTGIATALSSIDICPCNACPLKRRSARVGRAETELLDDFAPRATE